MEFLQNRRSSENQKPPDNRQKKWTFPSLAFYNAPSLHIVNHSLFAEISCESSLGKQGVSETLPQCFATVVVFCYRCSGTTMDCSIFSVAGFLACLVGGGGVRVPVGSELSDMLVLSKEFWGWVGHPLSIPSKWARPFWGTGCRRSPKSLCSAHAASVCSAGIERAQTACRESIV